MADRIRLGVAGLTHGHVWGLIDGWKGVDGADLVAVADRTPLLDKAKDDFGRSYSDWREMLDKEELDAVLATSDNVESSEIAVEALGRGLPVMVEKAMAANAADADRMLEAQRKSCRLLVINWWLAFQPWLHALKRELDAGTVGPAFYLHYRVGHRGPREIGCDEYFVGWLYDEQKNGGGAIGDFCSYGAAMTRWLFGMPSSVNCARENYTKDYDVSDDHTICLLKYPKKIAIIEGTWATNAEAPGANPVVKGRDGTFGVDGGKLTLYRGGREPQDIVLPGLTDKNGPAHFARLLRTGGKPEGILDPEICADGNRITDAAIRSSSSGCDEKPGR